MFSKRMAGLVCASAAVVVSFIGCSDNPTKSDNTTGVIKLFIAESDFQSGLLEWASTADNAVLSSNLSI